MTALAVALARIESNGRPVDETLPLTSAICSQRRCESRAYLEWCRRFHEPVRYQRKQWEKFFVCQALHERGLLGEGRRGIAFGVGLESLPSLFASMDCEILATDQPPADAKRSGWSKSGFEYAPSLTALNELGLCDKERFSKRVRWRDVDMRNIPSDLKNADFCWSCCALEHLGSIEAGLRFIEHSVDCLRQGGVAVHTLEFNLDSNDATITEGGTVLFRRRDIEGLVTRLEANGHHVEPVDWDSGDALLDNYVDVPPYHADCHLRLKIAGYRCTSLGLIIVRGRHAAAD